MKLYEILEKILKKEPNFVDDGGELKKRVVLNKAQNSDVELIKLLLDNKKLKEKFFWDLKGTLVFNKDLFVRFFEQKNYLNDSYTQFKQKVGLQVNGKYLKQDDKVELVWPYKDCILEGGQSKEEEKREEIFFNETLAQDEITQLLEPKVLTNAKVFDKDSKKAFSNFTREAELNKKRGFSENTITDNLMLKGNNLLAMHSLKEKFSEKVKLIYMDPPYRTGKDSFGYNDKFHESSWLTFMKNRLTVARDLLKDDGSIWISLDDKEVHYCKLLMDEVFGRENFIATIIWHSKYTVQNDAKNISYQHENILFYAKKKEHFSIGKLERTEQMNKVYKNPDDDPKGKWRPTPIHAKSGKEENNYTIKFPNGFTWTPPEGRYPRFTKKSLQKLYDENGLHFVEGGTVSSKTYLSEVEKDGVTPGSVWHYDDVGHTHGNNEELAEILGKGAFDNPKGTKLISQILKVGNVNDEDLVLDCFVGSGTTANAVLKLNKADKGSRRFIVIEQLDYVETKTIPRLQNVIKKEFPNESFVFFELKKYNQKFIEQIVSAKDTKGLLEIWKQMKVKSFLNYNVDMKKLAANIKEFKALDLEEQKEHLLDLLDKNQLYINLSSLNDKDFECTEEEKLVTKDFYQT